VVFCKHHGLNILVQAITWVSLMPKRTQWTCNTRLRLSHKYIGFHNISFENVEGYCVALPAKVIRKPILSLKYFVIKHHGLIYFGLCYWRGIAHTQLLNTPIISFVRYPINTLGSITYFLKLGILHNLTKTYKESNTLLGVFNKHHGLNYFGLEYQRGSTYV
jgi:hypothetical protein